MQDWDGLIANIMLIQLVEWVEAIPKLLLEEKALPVDARFEVKRKVVGFELIGVHQSIWRIARNAREIHAELRKLNDVEGEGKWTRAWMMQAMREQRTELLRIEQSLQTLASEFPLCGGESIRLHISQVFDETGTMRCILLSSITNPESGSVMLPKEFDATKLGHDTRLGKRRALLQYLSLGGEVFQTFHLTSNELKQHAHYLLQESSRLNSAEKLQTIAEELANLIKANFKMDELFGNSQRARKQVPQ